MNIRIIAISKMPKFILNYVFSWCIIFKSKGQISRTLLQLAWKTTMTCCSLFRWRKEKQTLCRLLLHITSMLIFRRHSPLHFQASEIPQYQLQWTKNGGFLNHMYLFETILSGCSIGISLNICQGTVSLFLSLFFALCHTVEVKLQKCHQ